ncbi:MAG: metal-dependent transcriptional regulator [Lachnospiraceae bacterium]|nr:metal-dependent transcriptional regulator [Lachnospiraceae bacterium]
MTYIKHKSEESMEDYLETILLLHNKNNKVRSIDIVSELGYSKPSVSIAMKGLREKGLITMDEFGYITLTKEGIEIAEKVLERHTVLSDWLIYLGVSEKTAKEDACRIEHDISEETFEILKQHCLKRN